MIAQLPESLPIFLWPHAATWNWELLAFGLESLPWIIGIVVWIYFYKKAVASGEYIVLGSRQRKLFKKQWIIAAMFILFAFLLATQLYDLISRTVRFNKALVYTDRPVAWYKRIAFASPIIVLTKNGLKMPQPIGIIPWPEIVDAKIMPKSVDGQQTNQQRLVIQLSPMVQEEMKDQLAKSLQKQRRRRRGNHPKSETIIAERSIQKENGNLIIADDYMLTLPRLKELIDFYRKS